MYFTYYLTWYESTIDRSFSIAFYSRTLLYMGIIRKCVCDIFSTIGLHPVSKSYIMQYEITIHLVYYISYTFHVGKAIKSTSAPPFFKSLLHSNKHFFVCQNMYTRLLIQIWPIIKCSFAVCFWKAIGKKFLLKCFKNFFQQTTTRFVRNPGALEIPQSGCNAKRIKDMKM